MKENTHPDFRRIDVPNDGGIIIKMKEKTHLKFASTCLICNKLGKHCEKHEKTHSQGDRILLDKSDSSLTHLEKLINKFEKGIWYSHPNHFETISMACEEILKDKPINPFVGHSVQFWAYEQALIKWEELIKKGIK